MDLNKANFEERLPAVREAISACDFYAIDMEFSGLSTASWRRPSPLDTLETRYQNVRDSASSFMLLQLGVACFKTSDDGERCEARCFNIDVAPPRGTFTLDAESIAFLSGEGFDFTRCFRDGVPYLQRERADQRAARIAAQDAELVAAAAVADQVGGGGGPAANKRSAIKISREEDQKFIADSLQKITDARAGWQQQKQQQQQKQSGGGGGDDEDEDSSLALPPCNAFLRRLLYQEVEAAFEDVELAKADEGGGGAQGGAPPRRGGAASLVAKWVPDVGERRARETARGRAKLAEAAAALQAQLGATLVVDALAASRKALVGHNCLLDLCHLWHHFVAPLPPTAAEFADAVHERFPLLVDTKQLVSATGYDGALQARGFDPRATGTALGDLFALVTTTKAAAPAPTAAAAAAAPEAAAAAAAAAAAPKAAAAEQPAEVAAAAKPAGGLFSGVAPTLSLPAAGEGFGRYGEIAATCGSSGGSAAGAAAAAAAAEQATATASAKSDTHAHEAGFDAFMTGVVFARWVAALGQPVGAASSSTLLGGASSAQPPWAGHVFNHFFLMRMRTTLRFPWHAPVAHNERGNVVHVRDLPRGTRADAVAAVFDKFCGRGGGKAAIYWVDGESLFLKYDREHMALACLRACCAAAKVVAAAAKARAAAGGGEEEERRGLLESVRVVSFAAYERRCAGLDEEEEATSAVAEQAGSSWARYLALGIAKSAAKRPAEDASRGGAASHTAAAATADAEQPPAKRARAR